MNQPFAFLPLHFLHYLAFGSGPDPAVSEGQRRFVYKLMLFILLTIGLVLMPWVMSIFVAVEVQALAGAIMMVICVVAWVMVRFRFFYPAGYLMLGTQWGLVYGFVLSEGYGIYSLYLTYFIVPILSTAVLFRWRYAVFLVALTSATIAHLAFIPTTPGHYPPADIFTTQTVLFVAITFLAYITSLEPKLISAQLIDSQKALAEREKLYRTVTEIVLTGIFRLNKHGELLYANPRWYEISGYPAGRVWLQDVFADDQSVLKPFLDHPLLYLEHPPVEFRYHRPDGKLVWLLGAITGEYNEQHRLVGYIGTATDITTLKEVEQALRESEKRYRLWIESVNEAICLVDRENLITYCNREMELLLAASPGALVGQKIEDFWQANEENLQIVAHQRALRRAGHYSQYEISWTNKADGMSHTAIVKATPLLDEKGEFTGTISAATDITDRKITEEALRQSEAQYRLLVETMQEGVFIQDENTSILYANDQLCHLFGLAREDLVGQPILNCITLDAGNLRRLQEMRRRLKQGENSQAEIQFTNQKQELKIVLVTAQPFGLSPAGHKQFIGTLTDITQKVQTERALQQAQKIESLGVLAGGVAHDFNNLLVAMLGQTSLALQKLPADSPGRTHVEKATKAAENAARLTKQLLAFSGKGHFEVQQHDLNQLLHDNLPLLEVVVPPEIELVLELTPQLPPIWADASQLQQVMMNLSLNAAEAIGPRPGKIILRTQVITLPQTATPYQWVGQTQVQKGQFVELQVQDTGPGIAPELVSKIFDPFFTTKSTGRGLGLAAVTGIVRGHQGGMAVSTTPGRGTTFYVLFPTTPNHTA